MANYSIDEKKNVGTDETTGKRIVRVEMWAASTASVPAYNALDVIFAPGSIAMIPDEGKFLILDFDNTWKEWGEA